MDKLDASLARIIIFGLFCVIWAFMLPVPTYGQESTGPTQVMNGVDDGTYHVNLGHSFPYYDGVFTDAWMSSNGVIILYDPTTGVGNPNYNNSMCCSGRDPSNISYYSYMIAPLWTDLIHITSVPDSGYFYETDTTGTRFLWQNIAEFYNPNNLNTFGVELWPDGSFDFHYDEVKITNHSTGIGFTGDTTRQSNNVYDEVNELFYKTQQEGGMTTEHIANFASEETNYGYAWYSQDGGFESGPDCSNPLNDTSCEGYEEAYFNQQCSNDPLYDTQCPGYAEAYYEQQCSADPLYDSGCSGYAEALFDYNCTLNPQYDMLCPGYIDEEMFAVEDTVDTFSGVDDGSDDGTGFDMYGVEEPVYVSEDLNSQSVQNETFVNSVQEDVQITEEFIINEQPEIVDTEELVANDGSVNEEQVLQESIAVQEETIEEELVVLEEMEVVDVLEEEVLEEEIELDEVELVPVTEKTVATAKVDATSLVLAQTAELVSNLRAKNEENYSQTSSNEQNGQEITQNGQSASGNQTESAESTDQVASSDEKMSDISEDINQTGNYMSPEAALFGSDNAGFAMLTGSVSNETENVTENEQNTTDTENVEQNLALGDSAPIGFAIIPVQQAGGVVEVVVPIEEQSLAERLAEQVRQRNLENSNDAAVGQTAALARLATAVSMEQYYGNLSYSQDMYMQEQVYQNVIMQDNQQSHYNLFSENHGTMRTLIRSQY